MRYVHLLALVMALGACGPNPAPGVPVTTSAAAAAAPASAARPTKPTPEQLANAEAFARAFETRLREGRFDRLDDVLDADALARAVRDGAAPPGDVERGSPTRLEATIERGFATMFAAWQSQDPTFKQVVVTQSDEIAARFRLTDDDGIEIVDVLLDPRGTGFRIRDLVFHTHGVTLVREVAQIDFATPGAGVSESDVASLRAMLQAYRRQEFGAMEAAYGRLSPKARDDLVPTLAHIRALRGLADDAAYARALEAAAVRFPAPHFRFALIDLHIDRQDWDAAIRCVDELMASVGLDAALLALRAAIEKLSGDVARARATIHQALALEPTCTYAHAHGIDVLLAAEDWAGVRDSMLYLEGTGRYSFAGELDDPMWRPFLEQPESARWR